MTAEESARTGGAGTPGSGRRAPDLPEGITIRQVGEEYFIRAAEFRFRMFADIDPNSDHSTERDEYVRAVAEYFRRHAADPGQVLVFAFTGDLSVGCAAMQIEERPPRLGGRHGDFAYIHNVYVLPDYRGRGIARVLMEILRREAESGSARRIGLHASSFGAPLYANMGFAPSGRYMELELSDR